MLWRKRPRPIAEYKPHVEMTNSKGDIFTDGAFVISPGLCLDCEACDPWKGKKLSNKRFFLPERMFFRLPMETEDLRSCFVRYKICLQASSILYTLELTTNCTPIVFTGDEAAENWYKCPECGGDLSFDYETSTFVCASVTS